MLRNSLAIAALLLAASIASAQTQTFTATDGAKITYTPAPVATPPVTTPPVTTPPPASGIVYGYHNGKIWAGDYSYALASLDYADKVGNPGGLDIAVTSNAFGAWQPFMCSGAGVPLAGCKALWVYSTAGFTKLTFKLKPTQANQIWQVQFVGVGDVALPFSCTVQVTPKYGPAAQVGTWATYTIPLADLCVGGGKDVYKFAIQDQTGRANNLWYVNDVGFAP
jgi:hypothetical protein